MTLQVAAGCYERAFAGDCEQCSYFIAVSIFEQLGKHGVPGSGWVVAGSMEALTIMSNTRPLHLIAAYGAAMNSALLRVH